MKVALFASDYVGLKVAQVLAEQSVTPTCLVIDDSNGRGTRPAIEAALSCGTVLRASELSSQDVLARLREQQLDLALLAWWPHILRRDVIDLFRLGCLNFHPSLLPYGRGKDPNFWAIVEGTPFGVSLHFVDEGIDTGPVAFQRELEVTWEDTGGSLYDRARDTIVELFRKNLPRILSGDIPSTPQDPKAGTFHRRRELDPASRLDLDAPTTAREVLNVLRARSFPGHPGTRFEEGGTTYEARVEVVRVPPTS